MMAGQAHHDAINKLILIISKSLT